VPDRLRSFLRSDPGTGQRNQGTTVFWILASTASALLLMGWLLPWFVGPFDAGVGFSAQDAVISSPTGIGTFVMYIVGVCMLILLLSPLAELIARLRGTSLSRRADRIRLVAGLVGLALTAVVWFLYSIVQEEPLFGAVTPGTFTDSAV